MGKQDVRFLNVINLSSWPTKTCLSYITDNNAIGDLVTLGAKASAATGLT